MLVRRLPAIAAALALTLAACGGSGSSSDSSAGDTVAPAGDSDDPGDSGNDPGEAPVPSSGSGTATITVADGTVYEFEMSSCETSNNVDSFLVDPGYDLSGRTDDGFRFHLTRAAFEEPTFAIGDLEGLLDENGVNPEIEYVIREPGSVIVLDGSTITGDLVLDGFISENKIHGEEATATLLVTC